MCGVFIFFLAAFGFAQIHGLNEILRATQPLYGMSTLSAELENNATCFEHLITFQRAVDEEKAWALKAMDASGRPESGFIYGNNFWIGSHAQCKDISNRKEFEINQKKSSYIKTPFDYPPYPMAFTMVYLKHNSTLQHHTQFPLEWTIQLGLCPPASCTNEEVLLLAQIYFDGDFFKMQNIYHLNLEVVEVKTLDEGALWFFKLSKTITLIILFSAILLFTIVGTVYDVRRHNAQKILVIGHNGNSIEKSPHRVSTVEMMSKSSSEDTSQPSTLGEIVKCFSIYSNTKNLMRTKLPSDSISCIHGLRFIGMLWVIAVHSLFYQADYIKNVPIAYRLSEDIFAQILSNSTYAVDTYLFLSGFLVSYLYYKSKNPHEKSTEGTNYISKVNEFFMMVINRLLRLTPPYWIIILFTDVVYTFFRQTSSLTSSERPDLLCEKYWWRNLLYINNLFPRSEMCLSWSWYLSLDMQFFVITSFLLILSTIAFKLSLFTTFLLILINIAATTYKSYSIGYIPTMDEQFAQLDAIYDLPWMRIGPYLVGVITGYILIVKLHKELFLTKRKKIFLWMVFSSLNVWILFTLYTRQVSVEFSAVYMGISRTLWGIGLSWILIACCTGNARALEKFLSFRGFIPLSRLTYCAYLLNPVAANMVYLGSESAFSSSLAGFALTILGITLTTFYMSFLFSVLVESPFILLTKLVFNKITRKKSSARTPQN